MPRQESFNGGELAPELYSKTGFAKYASGAKRLRNFIPARSGAAMSRPGLDYLNAVKGGDVISNSSTRVRLIPFVYSSGSTTQNYALEFGDSYFRVWNQGALVTSGGSPIEVATPYAATDLPYLKYVQSGDVLELTCIGHDAAKVTRVSHTSWNHGAVDFTRTIPTATPVALRALTFATDAAHPFREWTWQVTEVRRAANGHVYETAPVTVTLAAQISEWDVATAYASGTWVTYQGHLYKTPSGDTGHAPTAGAPYWNPKDDALTGLSTFSLPLTDVVYPDKPRTLALRTGTAWTSNDPLIASRIYRGRSDPAAAVGCGVFGWVGDTNGATFTDLGDEPDFSQQPPQGRNPFKVYAADGTLTRTEQPAAVAFFEERLIYAGTTQRPAFVFTSATADYANFDSRIVPVADEELEFELASRRREEIRSALGEDALFIFTGESVWEVDGQGGPLTFDNISARRRSRVGASWVDPIATDEGVLYVRNGGAGVRLISYELERQGYVGSDLSEIAAHLFRGHQVVDWTYAEKPWSVVWAVRDDGLLISFTFDAAQQVWAWAWHDTPIDADGHLGFESVCAIPEGTEDAVYVVVRRTCNDEDGNARVVRYVERFHSRVPVLGADGKPDVNQNFALDAAISVTNGSPTSAVSGLGHLNGQQVYAVADGAVMGPFTVALGAIDLGIPEGATVVHVGLAFLPQLQTLEPARGDDRVKPKIVTAVGFEVTDSRGLSAGQDFDHLTEWKSRKVSDSYGATPFVTDTVRVPVGGRWGSSGSVCLQQNQPLPVTVTALIIETEVGG